MSKLLARIQGIFPLDTITYVEGWIADIRIKWIKNWLIRRFIKKNHIDMSKFLVQDITKYASLNDFFVRRLKPEAIKTTSLHAIASPAEATIVEFGILQANSMIQAKNKIFTLNTLLAGHEMQQYFSNGSYMIFFLKPENYHRFHMPFSGRLLQSIYVPGRLYGVEFSSQQEITDLYGKNERFITLFETTAGYMAMVLIGALAVGRIKMAWHDKPFRANNIIEEKHENLSFDKNEELGYFKAGSTIILLFEPKKVQWNKALFIDKAIEVGAEIGELNR